MDNPYQKCYHKNWNEGDCPNRKNCSMEDRCKRWQWQDCLKASYGTRLCNGCPTLPACQNEKKKGRLSGRQALALILAMSESMRLRR